MVTNQAVESEPARHRFLQQVRVDQLIGQALGVVHGGVEQRGNRVQVDLRARGAGPAADNFAAPRYARHGLPVLAPLRGVDSGQRFATYDRGRLDSGDPARRGRTTQRVAARAL
jgi:hypothetical protein